MRTPGTIEITWNYGSEKEEGPVYNTGNADATGTGDGGNVRVRAPPPSSLLAVWCLGSCAPPR